MSKPCILIKKYLYFVKVTKILSLCLLVTGGGFSRLNYGKQLFSGKKLKIFGSSKSGLGQEWSPDMNTGLCYIKTLLLFIK